jgi:Leucine-rich repeat (LRR) protein
MGNAVDKEFKKYKNKETVDVRKKGVQELPENIGKFLAKCKELVLAENDITTLPDDIGKLPNLLILDASNNRINGLPFEIGQLKTLKELNLANNKLFFAPLTPELGKLKDLTKLDLSNNQLDDLPAELGNLASLEWFNLSHNQVKVIPPEFGLYLLQALQTYFLKVN